MKISCIYRKWELDDDIINRYTFSSWPEEFTKKEAETGELIMHIHFDAKYKVNNFYDLISKPKVEELTFDENEELIKEEEDENEKGTFKNQDLLKMHAYKDAIRRTRGAYVLYPGEGKDEPFRGFHELIPGLGAFVVRPNNDPKEKKVLENFILKVIDNFLDRASQRENISSKVYNIYKDRKDDDHLLKEPMPEYLNGKRLIPDDIFVLVGYSTNPKRFAWYEENRKYIFRMNDDSGSLIFTNDVVNSKYLLLRKNGKESATDLYKITSEGPKVFSLQYLESLGYPKSDRPKSEYLAIEIEKVKPEEFKEAIFNFKELTKYIKIQSNEKNIYEKKGLPFTVTLKELMFTKLQVEKI